MAHSPGAPPPSASCSSQPGSSRAPLSPLLADHMPRHAPAQPVTCISSQIGRNVHKNISDSRARCRSHEFGRAFDADFLSDARNCPYRGRSLLAQAGEPQPFNVPDFFRHAAVWLVVSSAASLLLGMAFLLLFKHAPHTMVRATIQVQIAVPLAMGILALLSGQIAGGAILLGLAALSALAFYLWRNEIELCARLLGVAAVGLHHNPGLIGFVLLSKLVLSGLILPIFGLIFFSYTNGAVVPNGARGGSAQCVDAQGQRVPCCAWQPRGWVGPYMALASVTMLWTIFVFGQLRVYVLSGTIAQWYFAPPEQPGGTKGTTLRSVKHALGPSFGTLSFGAAVLTAVEICRNALEQARQNSSDGAASAIFWSLLSFFAECIYGLIEYLTKFATVMAAITGEGFLAAGRRSTDLLVRNFLRSYGVWWFPPLVLQLAAFSLAATWGIASFLAYWLASHARASAKQEGAVLGVVSFFVAWVVLSFFSAILLDIVDATYLCFALDKDAQSVTKAEVHELFSQVPVGVAVEQPGGELQYGNPGAGSAAQPHAYVPPSHPAAAQNFRDSAARV